MRSLSWRLGLQMVSRRTNVSSRLNKKLQRLGLVLAIYVLCPRRYFTQTLQATLIKWAKSAVAIMSVLARIGNRSMYDLVMDGWWSHVMLMTCSFAIASKIRPILTSRWHLVTYKHLVSVSSCLGLISGFNVSCPSLDTSVQGNLAKGRIAVLLPLAAANAFVHCLHWASTFISSSRRTVLKELKHSYITIGQNVPKSDSSHAGSGSHKTYGSLYKSDPPNGILIGSAVFAHSPV